jgi:GT2 family glycosyltransferase
MADSKTLAVSIINYNSKQLLSKLLPKIMKQENLNVWVVDNASPDKGGERLKKEFPKIHFIESKENGGFAKGHNLVLKQIKTEFVALVNPDIEIPDDAISKMTAFMKENPNCGVASCKIVDFAGNVQSNGGNLPLGLPFFIWLFNLEMFPGVENIAGSFHRTDENYYNQTKEVGWVGGTFMFIRTDVLKKVNFMSEEYFMYVEDVDLCFMIKSKGYKIMINPEVVIKHKSGASSKDPHFAQFKGESVGLEIFYNKHFGAFSMLIIKLFLYVGILARVLAFTVVGKSNIAQTYWKVLAYV